jgi:butyryl-CoA dehydrogenase
MQAFGHTVIAWLWLDVAHRALSLDPDATQSATAGKGGAAAYFFHYELPRIGAWLNVVEMRDATCMQLPEGAF